MSKQWVLRIDVMGLEDSSLFWPYIVLYVNFPYLHSGSNRPKRSANCQLALSEVWIVIQHCNSQHVLSTCHVMFSNQFLCRILLSTPFAVVSYFLIWCVPPFDHGKIIWYLIFYCFFQTLQTVCIIKIIMSPQTCSLGIFNIFDSFLITSLCC